jgi:hypothetical protein
MLGNLKSLILNWINNFILNSIKINYDFDFNFDFRSNTKNKINKYNKKH